jgi:ABC-type sugar transport system ATPase subunit
MVFQSYALYPHMTVAQNIGFPLKMVGVKPAEIERQVADAAAKVNIRHLLERRPGQLSGGQQQRCALARAIVRQPRLFLLDEPLSNLDAKLRLETRLELHALQRSLHTTTVYVTHDQEEAMTLADRIAVFMEGHIAQIGTPREVFTRPQTMAVAAFVGTPQMNLLPGTWAKDAVSVDGHKLQVARTSPAPREVMLGVRPSDLCVAPTGLPAHIERIEDLGDSAIVSLTSDGRPLKIKGNLQHAGKSGEEVFVSFAPHAAHLFDPNDGRRL